MDTPNSMERDDMDEADSSPPPPTTKAAGRRRSTTSSTTDVPDDDAALLPIPPRTRGESPERLTPEEQDAILEHAEHGIGAGLACRKLGLAMEAFWNTLAADLGFKARYEQTQHTLNLNVASKAYQSAMGGNVSMQQFLLRQLPPFFWNRAPQTPTQTSLEHASDDTLLEHDRAAEADRRAVRTLRVEVLRFEETSCDLPSAHPDS